MAKNETPVYDNPILRQRDGYFIMEVVAQMYRALGKAGVQFEGSAEVSSLFTIGLAYHESYKSLLDAQAQIKQAVEKEQAAIAALEEFMLQQEGHI